mgnify:FL=1|jgi:hypothetical protein
MKFDFAIGNPPYNEEAPGESTSDKPVYHTFMDAAFTVADKVELITPARFLFDAGGTPSNWNKKVLNDPHFQVLMYESDTKNVFPSVDLPGGIAITYRDATKSGNPIRQFIQYKELADIVHKVQRFGSASLNTIMYPQNKFDLKELYKDYPNMKSKIGSEGKDKRFRQIVMERFPEIFTEQDTSLCVRTLGLIGRKREYRYIKRKYVEHEDWIDRYKVFVPFSNGASGTLGSEAARIISKPAIGYPNDGMTQTFIGVGSFSSSEEAENLRKYILSKFARVLLGALKVTQGNKPETWAFVPLQDFTPASDIDWSVSIRDIDQQLYKKYGLSQQEIDFIESHVKEMA